MKSSSRPSPNGAAKKVKKGSSVRKFTFTVIKFLVIFFVALGCALAGIGGGAVYAYIKTAVPISDEQLQMTNTNRTTFIYDAKGNVIQKLTGKDNKDSEPITDKEVPENLKNAIIAIEDERFKTHIGIDFRRIFSAAIGFVTESNSHGGSTITQQVVKNITGNEKRSLERKIQEWYLAIQLERKLEKWQILEMYMNVSYWGHSCYGVQSASKKYFGKPVQELTLAQCAVLAGITNRPGRYDPFTEQGRINAKERQEVILSQMLKFNMISKQEYDEAKAEDLKYASPQQSVKYTSVQSYFVDQVIIDVRNSLMKQYNISSVAANNMIYSGGLEIHTTMDPGIQSSMDQVFMDDKYFPLVNDTAKRQLEHPQGAMVIIDARNGQVKALYGGYGKKEASNTLNRASSTLMKRQPGSSIKPIALYAPAIDMKLISPATIVDDIPVYMKSPLEKDSDKEYPRNYDNTHDGLTAVRFALKNSVNVVAAKLWRDVLGPDNSVEYLKKVGIDRDEKYLSLVMGGLETGVNPMQMAAAYVPFVHKGMYYEPTTFTLVKDNSGKTLIDKKPVYETAYSEQTAFIMRDMMKGVTLGREQTYPHSGTAAAYINEKIIGMPVAGKTGTTSSNIDKWFVGYTPYYTAAVWYGYDNNGAEPIALKKAEYNQAMIIWAAVMKKVSASLPRKDFDPQPTGIVQKKICIYSDKIATPLCEQDPRGNATRMEYFVKGTEPRDDDLCNVHIQAPVCTESKDAYGRNLLAGPYCPQDKVVTKVFIQRKTPYVPTKPDEPAPKDVIYEYPAGEYCPVHGSPTQVNTGSAIDITIPDVYQETGSAIQLLP